MTFLEWSAGLGGAALVAWGATALVRRRKGTPRAEEHALPPAGAARRSQAATARRVHSLLGSTPGSAQDASSRAPVTDLRSREAASHEADEQASDDLHLTAQLADIRDECEAEEAVLWRWDDTRDLLSPAAWSRAEADRPQGFDMAVWGPLARWVAQERMPVLDAGEPAASPKFAGAPVVDNDVLVGVLTVTHAAGLGIGRDRARQWMPRYAGQVLRLLLLSESRREHARQQRQSQSLMTAIREIQGNTTQEGLADSICRNALDVSSGTGAALVHWRSEKQKGAAVYTTAGFLRQARFPVDADTLVARACVEAEFRFFDEPRPGADAPLISAGDGGWPMGSIVIVPLKSDARVIGALVVVSNEETLITHDEFENLKILGEFSATPLQILWEFDEVSRRASTDGLTGLGNRRTFDEYFRRQLNEADRFGQPLALILVDIDHFKRVNDTWGHEAGDEVLRLVAGKLKEGVRNVDELARYGGEEFAILLSQTSVDGAMELADRLRQAVEGADVKYKGEDLSVTISCGIAAYRDGVSTREGLFRAADRALYDAKRAGRNCVRAVGVSPEVLEG
ncbi:MAG TPA: sensor domain-containing diguanylate cyclase [Gemmatimonadaceae bacterium]|nr:sensor domain-containing diguanylate cyclase [Gemmatimonadaceae bacterium]